MGDVDAYKLRIKSQVSVAESYATGRRGDRHAREMRLVERGLTWLDPSIRTVLDAPCGAGRATVLLARHGYEVTGCDLGDGAVEVAGRAVAEAGVQARVEKADIEHLPYADASFDAILCFRMFHHFPTPDIRSRVVAELCRVASRYVLISYLEPLSWTSLRRRLLKARYQHGRHAVQYATSVRELEGYFREHGFSLTACLPEMRFFHSLWLAVFERRS
ncbi:MAG: putative methyltransferase YcgJ [Planctomycetes bacterium ADurb.Bin126]|nr:MAG: putative methyltransferase YcgJ [Planctomycetes bacterium ADurb.Bin126]HOD80475.1 class I SAM-dependent methyltransferase [Phycisphaerae bacterium]HQL72087.1 class I SAM-dependent methyltransferase [Phycisphaerae bacterium]